MKNGGVRGWGIAGVLLVTAASAGALVNCVGDQSNTTVVFGDGGPNSPTLPDGAPNPNYDAGASKTDSSTGPTGCAPCVVGTATIGNCCVQ